MSTTKTTTRTDDTSFLLPIFLGLSEVLSFAIADITRRLQLVEKAISMAEEHMPNLPELPLLREQRRQLLKRQQAVLATDAWFQKEQLAMEPGYAANSAIDLMAMLAAPPKPRSDK